MVEPQVQVVHCGSVLVGELNRPEVISHLETLLHNHSKLFYCGILKGYIYICFASNFKSKNNSVFSYFKYEQRSSDIQRDLVVEPLFLHMDVYLSDFHWIR